VILVKRLDELCDQAEFDAAGTMKDLATGASANRRGDIPGASPARGRSRS
jgi:hypothetical protein